MQRSPRLYTHAEATALLPRLRELIATLQDAKRQFDAARQRLSEIAPAARANGAAAEARELERALDSAAKELRAGFGELEGAGVELKDLDAGLLDFPSLRDGRVVYLCWLVSEPTIAFWHELDGGFAGRQPL